MSKLDQGLKERQKITKTQQREIRGLYQEASDNLKKKIEALESKGGSYSLQKAELDKLVKELKRQMEEIGLESQNLIENGISSTVDSTVKDAKRLLSSWGLSIEGAYSSVPSKVIESLITGKVYKGNWSLSGAIWEDIGKTQKDITRIVSLGLAENKTIYEIAKDLEKYVNPSAKKDWDWSKVYPGTKKVVDYNAQRLARTLINHAYQRTMVVTSLNNPFIKGLKWETSNAHGRVCDLCMERANSDEYGLGSGVFPVDKVPLDHPNGMCILTQVLLDSSDRVNRLANWAKGGSDPELDKWVENMYPGKVSKMSSSQKEGSQSKPGSSLSSEEVVKAKIDALPQYRESKFKQNPIPMVDRDIWFEADDQRRYREENDLGLQWIRVSDLETSQSRVSGDRLKGMIDNKVPLGTVDGDDEIEAILYDGHYILTNGNHRSSLAKLFGVDKLQVRVRRTPKD